MQPLTEDRDEKSESSPGAEGALVFTVKTNEIPWERQCPVCREDHKLDDCPEYKEFSYEEIHEIYNTVREEFFRKGGTFEDFFCAYIPTEEDKNYAVSKVLMRRARESKVADCKGKTKAASAESSSRDCGDVKRESCWICERSEHRTQFCPYKTHLPPGAKVGPRAEIICTCCCDFESPVDHDDPEEVEYFARVKLCGYCLVFGHSVTRFEDCPNTEAKECERMMTERALKNWGSPSKDADKLN